MSYGFEDSFRAGPRWSCSKAVYKPVWHIPLVSVHWINSWWWTEELSETCRVSWQNKFVKLVHLVGFITKKFVTMHGHMNVIYKSIISTALHLVLNFVEMVWRWSFDQIMLSCRFVNSFRAGPGCSCSKAVYKPVWHIPVPSVQWINSWWWAQELPEICGVLCQNTFEKLGRLVGFIEKKKRF